VDGIDRTVHAILDSLAEAVASLWESGEHHVADRNQDVAGGFDQADNGLACELDRFDREFLGRFDRLLDQRACELEGRLNRVLDGIEKRRDLAAEPAEETARLLFAFLLLLRRFLFSISAGVGCLLVALV